MRRVIGAGVDWGSSNARAWSFDEQGQILRSKELKIGLQNAQAKGFSDCLAHLLEPLNLPEGAIVVACGMIGAKGGPYEVSYAQCPAKVTDLLTSPETVGSRQLFILRGISISKPAPDVMRGEETQVCGAVSLGHGGLFCLPGTHSKWVRALDGVISEFKTYVTGELFDVSWRYAIFGQLIENGDFNLSAFAAGIHAADDTPLLNGLFQVRSRVLIDQMSPTDSHWFLSGYLIGHEIIAANPQRSPVTLVADDQLAALYAKALKLTGRQVTLVSAETSITSALFSSLQSLHKSVI